MPIQTNYQSPMPTTKFGASLAAAGKPLYGGGINPAIFTGAPVKPGGGVANTPPIWQGPTPQGPPIFNGAPVKPGQGPVPQGPPIYAPPDGGAAGGGGVGVGVDAPITPPPVYNLPQGPQPIAAFDFSPFQGQAGYHQNPQFMQAWDDTFNAVGTLSPEQRAQFDELYAKMAQGATPGGGTGINLMRDAYNQVIGGAPADTGARPNPPVMTEQYEGVPVLQTGGGGQIVPEGWSPSGGVGGATMDSRFGPGANPRPTLPNEGSFAPRRYPRLEAREKRRANRPKPQETPQAPPNPRPTLPNEGRYGAPRRGLGAAMGRSY